MENTQGNQDIRPSSIGQNRKFWFFVILIIILIGVGYYANKNGRSGEKVDFDLYVMSQCPYGSQAEGLVLGVMDDYKDHVNFNVEYIANKNEDGTFSSLHGQPEVEGNKYQLCVKEHYPDSFWSYLECQNKNYQDLSSSFESCANEVGADFNTIQTCAQGEQGSSLLEASLTKAQELNVSGSPAFYIAGEKYTGPRTEIGIQRAMCAAVDDKARACKKLPQDKEFTAYLINDSRCSHRPECQVENLEQQLKSTFSRIEFKYLDYNNDEGKEFFEKYNLTLLPAVLFAEEIKETDNYAQVERYLQQIDDLYSLAIGSCFDPTKEICDNSQDDTGNDLVDCDDADCDGFLECRQEAIGRLDVFVMSMCPYGTRALDAMKEVLDNFGDKIEFHVSFIANENPDGSFQALHGQPEVDENIRQLCAIKYYPNTYMDYIWCRNQDIQGDWTSCAANFPAIKPCSEADEGQRLHSQNIKLANELGISASPTWMVNNRYAFSGIDAETIKQNFCKYNDVSGCEKVLGSSTGNIPAGACN